MLFDTKSYSIQVYSTCSIQSIIAVLNYNFDYPLKATLPLNLTKVLDFLI